MKGTLPLILLVALMLSSCGIQKEKQVMEAVERFSTAVAAEDYEAFNEIAPALGAADESAKRQLIQALRSFTDWKVISVHIEGNKARASVELKSQDRKVNIQIPLSHQDGRWIISENLSMSTTIDVIPAR